MIIRQFNLISQHGPNLEIIEQQQPDRVCLCIGNSSCTLDRKTWEELNDLSRPYASCGDYVRFVKPTKEDE